MTHTVFQSIELSHLISKELQMVPEGVWLELKPSAPIRLSIFHGKRRGTPAEAPLRLAGEKILEAGESCRLLPSQYFRLQSKQKNEGVSNLASGSTSGTAEFSCIPALYFNKKFNRINGLGQPHSEVAYFKAYYAGLHPDFGKRTLQVLDLGCGRGRNAVVFAGDTKQEYRILGVDQSTESLAAWNGMAEAEGIPQKLQSRQVDLNTWRELPPHDLAMAIVSLQFLKAQAAIELLQHCMAKANPGALHLAVFPVASEHPKVVWPGGFGFLPQSGEVKELYIEHGWSVLEYRESYGHLGKITGDGLPLRGVFAVLIAQKLQ